jgi:putative endonuclease
MKFYYTYVLFSQKDKKFYSGYTKDLQGRFEAHNKGKVESTKDRRPLTLIYYEASLDRKDAMKREKYFKTHHGKLSLRNRLKSYLTGYKNL